MREEHIAAGQTVWKRKEPVQDVLLIGDGVFVFQELPSSKPFRAGALLADVYSLELRRHHRLTLTCSEAGAIFRITGADFLEFLDNNPGAFIWMRDTLVVE